MFERLISLNFCGWLFDFKFFQVGTQQSHHGDRRLVWVFLKSDFNLK